MHGSAKENLVFRTITPRCAARERLRRNWKPAFGQKRSGFASGQQFLSGFLIVCFGHFLSSSVDDDQGMPESHNLEANQAKKIDA
jgi:hypothetical protein